MKVIDLGITGFLEAHGIQIDLVKNVSLGISENVLLLTEHRPCITIGRRGSRDNILKSTQHLCSCGIEVFNADRGGDVTYHGPGQLVAYPIFKLENEARDIHGFLHFLEEAGRHFLAQYGVKVEERPGFRGVWAGGKKIGSIGIGVKKWVTYHGIAINLNVDLAPFSFIRPCGIDGVEVSSLRNILDSRKLDIEDAKDRLKLSFKEVPLLAEAVCTN